MSAAEIINEFSKLTAIERSDVLGKLLEIEEFPLSEADEVLIESRLAGHHANPESSIPLEEMKRRLRSES